MDRKYLSPEIEIKKFDCEDVLKSSRKPVEITEKDGTIYSHYY